MQDEWGARGATCFRRPRSWAQTASSSR